MKELSEWIQFVQNPVVSAVAVHERAGNQVRTAQARQFVPFSPAVALVPDGPIRVPSRIPSGAMPLGTEVILQLADRLRSSFLQASHLRYLKLMS